MDTNGSPGSPGSHDESVYEAITGAHDDARWAFGTGFTDPLAGVDTTVPSTVDGAALAAYCLMLGDDALVMSHRLQEWVTRLPELEDEVAVANVALDLLGQARLLLTRAGAVLGRGEDDLAFLRDAGEFRNVLLAELVDADFAQLVTRMLVFSTWRLAVFTRLVDCADPVLAAIADKGVKELTYHRDYAARWVVRLGDGTELSASRARAALEIVWPHLDELFEPHGPELVDPSTVRAEVDDVLTQVLTAARLDRPRAAAPSTGTAATTGDTGTADTTGDTGTAATAGGRPGRGREGVHTEAMGPLLAELQGTARSLDGATW